MKLKWGAVALLALGAQAALAGGAGDTARQFLAAMQAKDRPAVDKLLADPVVAEYPFDRSGRTAAGSWRVYTGKPAVMAGYVDSAFSRIPKLAFRDLDVTESRDGHTAFVEAMGDMELAGGKPYRNRYVLRFDTDRQGRITHYKEYLNPVTSALAAGLPLGDEALPKDPGRCAAATPSAPASPPAAPC